MRLLRSKSQPAVKERAAAPPQPSITIPLYYPDVVRRVHTSRLYGVIQAMLAENDEAYAQRLRELSQYTEKLFRISLTPADDPREPYFEDNGYFSHLDAVALYCLVAHIRPRQIIEIGSGHSTKFMRRAVKDWRLTTKIVSIDPYPRAEVDMICDQVIRGNVLDVAPEFFGSLGENDFLFVDGSHLVFTGTDLPWVFFEILPRLAPGVIIHFHDIFLPEDYPARPDWQDRYYNEEYCLAAFLYGNPDYTVLLPNHYLEAFRPRLIVDNLDLSKAPTTDKVNFRGGASFWIQKRPHAL